MKLHALILLISIMRWIP